MGLPQQPRAASLPPGYTMAKEFYTNLYQHADKNLIFDGPAVDPVVIEARRSNRLRCNIPDILDGMEQCSEMEMDDEFETFDEPVTEQRNIVGTGMYLAFVLQHNVPTK
jgi:hypothetical protein